MLVSSERSQNQTSVDERMYCLEQNVLGFWEQAKHFHLFFLVVVVSALF